MPIFPWNKPNVNAIVQVIWKKDWFFHKFYSMYSLFYPNSLAVKQYNFGKCWLAYLTGKVDYGSDIPRYKGLDYCQDLIDTPAIEVITRGLINDSVIKLEFKPLLITDTALPILCSFLVQNQAIEEFGIAGPFFNDKTTMHDDIIRELGPSLKKNKKIRKLALNRIGFSEAGWSHLADLLKHNTVIKEIVLIHAVITVQAAIKLTEALENRRIEALILNDCIINDEATAVIADYLASGAKVNTVSLTRSGITAEGLKAIACALKSEKIRIKKLNLSGNVQAPKDALGTLLREETGLLVPNDCGIEAIFDALQVNKTLEEIYLSAMLVERIMILAASAIEKNSTLQIMDLSCNIDPSIRENRHSICPLAVALTINTTLRALNLAENGIDTEHLIFLSEHMGQFALKHLDLSTNNFSGVKAPYDAGLRSLAAGIKSNRSFTSLKIDKMRICYYKQTAVGEVNFDALKHSLSQHPTLRSLSLNHNYIPGMSIAKMLLHPKCRIKHLDITTFNPEDLQSFIKHIADNPAGLYLTTFKVNINYIDENLREELLQAIKPINAHRKEMLRGFYAFMMVSKKKERFGKEHPTKDKSGDRKLQQLPPIPSDIGRRIAEYADYRKPLQLL